LPDHSSLTRIRQRYGLAAFRRFFEAIVEQCVQAGLVWGQELYVDSTDVAANAAHGSLRPRFAVEDVHRFLTILTGVFLGIHVGALLLDTYTPFSLTQVLVPFASDYRPLATAVGVVALELLLAVALTNAVRGRIPYPLWRRAHYLTFGVWGAATLHGILAGSDRVEPWFVFMYTAAVASVAFAAAARLPARA
jgi:hypothetical protein